MVKENIGAQVDLNVLSIFFLEEKWSLQNILVKNLVILNRLIAWNARLKCYQVDMHTKVMQEEAAAGGGWEPKAPVSVFVTVTSSHQSLHAAFFWHFFKASVRRWLCLFSSFITNAKNIIKMDEFNIKMYLYCINSQHIFVCVICDWTGWWWLSGRSCYYGLSCYCMLLETWSSRDLLPSYCLLAWCSIQVCSVISMTETVSWLLNMVFGTKNTNKTAATQRPQLVWKLDWETDSTIFVCPSL